MMEKACQVELFNVNIRPYAFEKPTGGKRRTILVFLKPFRL